MIRSTDIKLAVLSRGRDYSTRRLVEEAKKRGLDVFVADPMKFSLYVADGSIDIQYMGEPFLADGSSKNRSFDY